MIKLKFKDKMAVGLTIFSTSLLLIALTCSIMLAAFTASKSAITTIQFHEGITMTVTGIDANGKWTYNINNDDNTFDSTSRTTGKLSLSPITAEITKGTTGGTTDVHIRVFAFVTTTPIAIDGQNGITQYTLPNDLFSSAVGTTSVLTDDETTFVNSAKFTDTITKNNTTFNPQYNAVAYTYSTKIENSEITLLNKTTLFNNANIFDSSYLGNTYQIKAYVRIYASTSNTDWGTGYTFSFTA